MHGKQLARYALCIVTAMTACFAVAAPSDVLPNTIAIPPTPTVAAPAQAAGSIVSAPAVNAAAATPVQSAQVWNLKNADIRAVIQTISILTGKNFIIDPRVHGNVTLISQKAMNPDEMYQVFLSMLQLLQYVAIPSGSAIKIVPAMDANTLSRQVATNTAPGFGDEIVVRVVPVNHVSATELVPVLRPLMSQSGSVSAYLPSNSLIFAGAASNISRLVEIAQQMDSVNTNQIEVVHLRYASAKKVVSIIHSLQSGGAAQGANNATLAADDEDNSILVNANMANQLLMKQLIKRLDRPGASSDDTKVVRLNYLTAKKLAPILSKIAQGISASGAVQTTVGAGGKPVTTVAPSTSGGGSDNDISIQAEDSENAIIMHAPKPMLASLMAVIRRLDVRPQEVLVEAIIVKVDENLLDQLGIQWGTASAPLASIASAAAGTALPSVANPNTFLAKVNNHGVGLVPDGNMLALLHLLKSNGSTDILSTPSVVVLDNQKASIIDGQNIGVANRSYQGVAGTPGLTDNSISPFNTIQRQDVALGLDVTPHISPNSMIQMTLLQKDDSLDTASDNATTQEQDNPTINTSKIKTSVLVHSGDILVLGGLTSSEQDKTTQKIPILGDLPLLGHLFRYETHTIVKQDLMVFIRPVVMTRRNGNTQTSNRYKYVRHRELGVQTEEVVHDTYPVLPQMGKETTVLPQPVPTFALPTPKTTGSVQ